MFNHPRTGADRETKSYFPDPYSSMQRGSAVSGRRLPCNSSWSIPPGLLNARRGKGMAEDACPSVAPHPRSLLAPGFGMR